MVPLLIVWNVIIMGIYINSRPATYTSVSCARHKRRLCISYGIPSAHTWRRALYQQRLTVEIKIYARPVQSRTEHISASEVTWYSHKIYDKIITHKSPAKQTSNSNMAKVNPWYVLFYQLGIESIPRHDIPFSTVRLQEIYMVAVT